MPEVTIGLECAAAKGLVSHRSRRAQRDSCSFLNVRPRRLSLMAIAVID
jgi:hypothetical protein